jgi:hypothetical protein
MIGRAAPTNMWVMSIQYDFSERMVLLTVERTYIQPRKKIKNKLASLEKNQMNKEIVARRQLSRQENCVENCHCLQQLVRQGPIACTISTERATLSIGGQSFEPSVMSQV